MMFSVIIPCYNSKNFIRQCVNSILAQDFDDYEIVIIDDGSTDGTSEILDEYAKKNAKINVHHFENGGASYSRRRGIYFSSGKYLIFVDSDDTINPHLLSSLYDAITNNDYPNIIRFQAKLMGDEPHKDHERYNYNVHLNTLYSGMESLRLWSIPGKKYAVYWLFAFKRSIFSKVLFTVNLRCYEDVALIPVLITASKKVLTIDYVGYNYTCNNVNSLTNIRSIEAERARAIDFLHACKYAVNNFSKLDNVTEDDILFFDNDYNRRLKGKYNSLPDVLKEEFVNLFPV